MPQQAVQPPDLALLVDHLGLVAAGDQRADAVEHVHEHQGEDAAEQAPLQGAEDVQLKGDRPDVEAEGDQLRGLLHVAEGQSQTGREEMPISSEPLILRIARNAIRSRPAQADQHLPGQRPGGDERLLVVDDHAHVHAGR